MFLGRFPWQRTKNWWFLHNVLLIRRSQKFYFGTKMFIINKFISVIVSIRRPENIRGKCWHLGCPQARFHGRYHTKIEDFAIIFVRKALVPLFCYLNCHNCHNYICYDISNTSRNYTWKILMFTGCTCVGFHGNAHKIDDFYLTFCW